MSSPAPDRSTVTRAPKVVLHDHLDGGLRPGTVLELAGEVGHRLPATDTESLAAWFRAAAGSGSLELYLETFTHTLAVMQTAEQLRRVARECAVDLAADGVVYAEVRFAPEQHLAGGLQLDEVVEAVQAGFAEGVADVAARGATTRVSTVLTAMRHAARSTEIAELAVRHRESGVVGFDIAGAEEGYPPSRHLAAFEYLHRENFPVTIHAGEAFGLPSIWEAVQVCGTSRLGHGVRIAEDIEVLGGRDDHGRPRARLGRTAAWVRDHRIPLEVCPTSNVDTGAARSVAEHPVTLLKDLRFRVTVNTDNRLVSGTSMSQEMTALVEQAGWDLADLRWATINAMKSAFLPFDERLDLIEDVVKPGYVALAAR
ncbi:adenosine deaminase [Georgenia sp. 10Sc9-8]|uniref:Adenosine deaminase n=1 Tax=Georgenia halotolerans TaxID=3028317 RepID=A0ABT5U0J3_9MICO|nr:adenosine deaminase [Georgenia halotolerans]